MPKHTIEFKLPEERDELDLHMKAGKMICVLTAFDSELRKKLKYEDLSEEEEKIYSDMRDLLYDFCDEYDLNIWE